MTQVASQAPVTTRPTLVGRDDELVLLRKRLAEAAQGAGSIVILAAEAGVGKTRMIEEISAIAEARSMCVLHGGAAETDSKTPQGLFIGVLREILADATETERDAIRDMTGRVMTHLWPDVFPGEPTPDEDSQTEIQPELRHSLFLSRLLGLLQERADRTPVLLCLEDLHWADSASLRVLNLLASRVTGARILVVVSVRPEEAANDDTAQLPGMLLSMVRHAHVHQVNLSPLSDTGTRTLVSSCFPREGFTAEFLDLLYRRSGGIPMQTLEYVRFLVQRGVIYEVHGLWINRDPEEEDIPNTVREAIQRRLESLNDAERLLLSLAAVQGHCFSGTLVASTLSQSLTRTLRELEEIGRRTRLLESTERGFRFAHPILADVFCKSLPESVRRHAHVRLAHIIERDDPGNIQSLAHHLFEAGLYDRALPALITSSRSSIAAFAYREARVFLSKCEQSSDALGTNMTNALRLDVLMLQGEVDYRLGEWQRSLEGCRQALILAGKDDEAAGRAFLQIAQVHRRQGVWEEAVTDYRRALDHFTRCGLDALTAKCQIGLGDLSFERSQLDDAQTHFDDARDAAIRVADHGLLGAIYGNLGVLSTVRGDSMNAVLQYTEAIKSYTRVSHRYGICQTHHNLGMCYAAQGELVESLASYERGEVLAIELGTLDVLANIKVSAASAHLRHGDIDSAETACQQASHLMDRLSDRLGAAECRKVEGMILRDRAEFDEGRERLEEGLHTFRELENELGVAECELELGVLERETGDLPASRLHLQQSAELFEQVGAAEDARRSLLLLKEMAA